MRFLCKGALGEYAACQCNEEDAEVACINAQFVDTSVFQYINSHYSSLKKVTFHGNNFQDLPNGPLFGDSMVYDSLVVLNISANYIVNLHQNAMKNLPNIQVLDLSNNEIVLTESNVHFLSYTPKLTKLLLRRAFTSVVNRTAQFNLMLKMFENANLKSLKVLDLSYNYLNSLPYQLPCPFPSLSKLDLRQNLLKSISLNKTCLNQIEIIDLSRNHFHNLDKEFREGFAKNLPVHSLEMRNSFYCDCQSLDYIQWVRTTNIIRDKNLLSCARSSPSEFVGAKLMDVPLNRLDCQTNLYSVSGTSSNIHFYCLPKFCIFFGLLLFIEFL